MEIRILHLIEGAKAAEGVTVIIDVFRAFSLEAYLFDMGADKIIPLSNVDSAYALKAENSEMILAGERHGRILPGFDTGNAPSLLHDLDVSGKTIIHTTSAGTQGIANAKCSTRILVASLVNARATAEYIKKIGAEIVSLVCMGLESIAPTEEDTLCAEYIKSILLDESFDIKKEVQSLKYTSGAKFFDPAQSDVFPTDDFYMCTDVDRFDFVMSFEKSNDGIGYVRRINIHEK